MVLVSVGDKNAAYLVCVFNEIADVRNDKVDTRHILVGKSHTAIDNDHIIPVLKNGHILSDLLNTAKTHNAKLHTLSVIFFHIFS